ncbi:ATP-binding protein [Paenibacillus aestuarii]|uniref:DNA topoisomerase (ATP-hydrolyzing) n=1 Tax=Paenibacillus aestuarii TaxID=516965 RepID=A0ABW0K7N0_9BACL|nr:ATP-binding protein [Paenibacillus aestuarii]
MTTSQPRDYGAELDALTSQMNELRRLVTQLVGAPASGKMEIPNGAQVRSDELERENGALGSLFYSGHYHGQNRFRWDPQQRSVEQLLNLDSDKVAKVLAALAHKQRLDILMAVMREPLTGAEIVERLNMGTTGQLYHHTKALVSADLLVQEERGGKYSLPPHRSLPFLLLLAAGSDLLDASDYMELADARNEAGAYLAEKNGEYDAHQLLWSVIEYSIMEHQAGFCSEINLILHSERRITVSDNGRGIPTSALPGSDKTPVQAVLTALPRNPSASVTASAGLKGINMPVVNALSQQLSVEIRRNGKMFRQDYKHGIPQTELLVIGTTEETGTSITLLLDPEIFRSGFDPHIVKQHAAQLIANYPSLRIQVLQGTHSDT